MKNNDEKDFKRQQALRTARQEKAIEFYKSAYRYLLRIANMFHYTLRLPLINTKGPAIALFLGNHSSGKSTLINSLFPQDVQATGVAPTDDGFTIICWGENATETHGPAALDLLPSEFATLSALEPEFQHHLCVKTRNAEFLKHTTLIDSPGMIDAAGQTSGRGYNFTKTVHLLAELADIVLFLFDPEKPGTTGETTDVLSICLKGFSFKLHVILNKCDTFTDVHDFARAYGTLCWNLARVLATKDLPQIRTTSFAADSKIQTVLSPRFREQAHEVISLITNDPLARRIENVADACQDDLYNLIVRELSLHPAILHIERMAFRHNIIALFASATLSACVLFVTAKKLHAVLSVFSLSTVLAWSAALAVFGIGLIIAHAILRRREVKCRVAIAEQYCQMPFKKIFQNLPPKELSLYEPFWNTQRSQIANLIASGEFVYPIWKRFLIPIRLRHYHRKFQFLRGN